MVFLANETSLRALLGHKNVENWVRRFNCPDADHFSRVWRVILEDFSDFPLLMESDGGRRKLARSLSRLFTWAESPQGPIYWSAIYHHLLGNRVSDGDKTVLTNVALALQGGNKATLEEMI